MARLYEKDIFSNEVGRVVYYVLTAEESIVVSNDDAILRSSRIDLVDKILFAVKALIKTTEVVQGGSVALSAKIHLPYVESMEIIRAREERDHYRKLYYNSVGEVEVLREKLNHRALPWYKKIWRSE